jgi:hypothetical protein
MLRSILSASCLGEGSIISKSLLREIKRVKGPGQLSEKVMDPAAHNRRGDFARKSYG